MLWHAILSTLQLIFHRSYVDALPFYRHHPLTRFSLFMANITTLVRFCCQGSLAASVEHLMPTLCRGHPFFGSSEMADTELDTCGTL